MAMIDQRPRETHLATTRYVNTSRTATSAIKAAAVAAGIVTASVAVPMATPPIAAHAAPASAVQSLASLDGQIRKLGSARDLAARAAEGALDEAAERLLLQRELVNRAGEQQLREFCEKDSANAELVDWLMGDLSALRHYILGGKVHTNRQNAAALPADYIQSLGILRDLRKAYGGDLTGADADVFLRMMIAASLDVSGRARLWTGDPGFVSDPLVRYNMIKVFRADSRYRFQKELFDGLPVETMRYVFENQIPDEELAWLANYSLHRYPNAEHEDSRLNAYSYVWYKGDFTNNGGYSYADFYDDAKFTGPVTEIKSSTGTDGGALTTWRGGWQEKYRLAYDDPNFPNQKPTDPYHIGCGETSKVPGATQEKTRYHRLWMAFEKGGVCGALAKTFANLNGMVGVPSFVVGQPGHAATLTYELRRDASGKMVPTYRVQNDVSGFGRSRNADVAHWMGDWGRTSTYDFRGGYALYAQEALADAEAYRHSYEARLVAASFDGDAAAQEEAMNAARAAQAINYDAICGQIDLMVKHGAAAEEWAAFASGLAEDLKFHPLPMHDLIKEINRCTENKYLVALDAIRMDALQKATQVTKDETVNRDACVSIAHALMGRSDGAVALFSYDGEHGGKIRLGEHLRGGGVAWKYSLDGGSSWTQLTAGETEVQLTGDQLESITAENDIKIQLIGANVVNSIDISKRELGRIMIEGNDRANRIYFQDGKVVEGLQMRVDGGTWEPFDIGRTYKGNRTVEVRRPATGMSAASEAVTFSFTAGERDASFVPYEEMAVNSYSSSRDGAAMANRVIDGYYGPGNEFWITKAESGPDAWIVIDLGHEREISSLTYWRPGNAGTNGVPRWDRMTVTVSAAPDTGLPAGTPVDGDQFTVVESYGKNGTSSAAMPNWNKGPRSCDFTFASGPVRGRYFKIHLTDIYFSATLFDFYEVHEPGLEAEPLRFKPMEVGQPVEALPIELVNTSKAEVTIESVTVDSDAFVVTKGNSAVAPEGTDSSWKISPAAGIAAGTHEAVATVTYRAAGSSAEARQLNVPLAVTVSPANVQVAISVEKIGGDSLRLSATVSGVEGLEHRIEYALCDSPNPPMEAPVLLGDEPSVQGNPLNTWTADPVFTSLMPGEKYYAFARVKGLPGLDAVTSDEVQVDLGPAEPGPELPGPDGGDGNDGNQGGNGNSNGGDGSDGSGSAPDGSEKPQRPEGEQSQPDAELDTSEETPGASGKPANGKPASGLPSTGDASMPMALGALVLGLSTAFAGLMQRLRRS